MRHPRRGGRQVMAAPVLDAERGRRPPWPEGADEPAGKVSRGFVCDGVTCEKYRGRKVFSGSSYDNGLVRCGVCGLFLTLAGVRNTSKGRLACKCCGGPIRIKRTRYTTRNQHIHDARTEKYRV